MKIYPFTILKGNEASQLVNLYCQNFSSRRKSTCAIY